MRMQKRILFDLATKNSQRLALEQLYAGASEGLKSVLMSHAKLFHPKTPEQLKRAVARCARLHSGTEAGEGIELLQTSYENNAISWFLERAKELPLGDYFLWFRKASGITFEDKNEWVPELPVLAGVNMAVVGQLKEIASLSKGHLAVVSNDGRVAVVMDSYSGFLQAEPSPEEIVYELAFWNSLG